jgi:multiple sugar transport system substrate-binding protein
MKHRSRKTMAAAGAILFAASAVLAGCSAGGETDAGSESTLTFWLWQDDSTDQTWTQLVDDFNAQSTNGTVEVQVIPLAQYEDKLLNALSSGGGPDAARFKDVWLGEFAAAGAVAPLGDRIDSWDGRSDVVPALLETGKVPGDDEIYLMPHQYTTLYMYYNKAIFADHGLEAPHTHEDVRSAAKTLADAGQYAIDVRGGAGGQDQWAAWMYSAGVTFVDAAGAVTLADADGVAANQDYLDLEVELGAAPPGSITADFAAVRGNFLNGTTAMMIHHAGSLAAVREGLGDDVGVIPMPSVDPANPVTLGSMSGNVVFAASEKQDLAWEWISWLATHDPMLTMSTSAQGQLPVLTSVAADPAFADDEGLQVALTAQETAKTWPLLPGTSTVVNKDWVPTLQSAFEGKMTSEQALQELATVLEGQ